jgi:AcrR family transcriptional regulator
MIGHYQCYRAGMTTARRDRPLRADAARNADRLVSAAAEVFAECGVEMPLDGIARRAGVGIATLYRHYPSKDELIRAVIERAYAEEIAPVLDRALRAADARQGLVDTLSAAMGTMTRHRHAVAAGKHRAALELLTAFLEAVAVLVARAQEQGTVRADLRPDDVPRLVGMLVSTVRHEEPGEPARWPRYLALLLDALEPDRATELPG